MLSLILAVCCASCAAPVPFRAVERVPVAGMATADVRAAFAKTMPGQYKLANTAVFHIRGRQMTGIGYLALDDATRSFAVTCMTPLGIKLFDLSVTNGTARCDLAISGVAHKDAFARVAAADIREIYFDLVPSAAAEVKRTRDSIVFRDNSGADTVEYVFAGRDGMLVEKRHGSHRRVRYYDYIEKNGKRFPGGIVFENRKYRYRLVLRLKEVLEL